MESKMEWRTVIEHELKELRDELHSIKLDLQAKDKIPCRYEKKKKLTCESIREKASQSLF